MGDYSVPGRPPTHKDRLCDLCHQPMIGIMRDSEPRPPRRVCDPCGGSPIRYDKRVESEIEAV